MQTASSIIAERFRTARLSRGLTQAQVAETLGLTQGYIGQIERGVLVPSLDRLRDYADTLGWDRKELSKDLTGKPRK
jgi:transcriptional regulator with XRE-family HTH domain